MDDINNIFKNVEFEIRFQEYNPTTELKIGHGSNALKRKVDAECIRVEIFELIGYSITVTVIKTKH